MRKRYLAAIVLILLIVVISEFSIFIVRAFSSTQLDDVTPGIPCETDVLEKSDVYFVVPMFGNKSIADNKTWCSEMIKSGKKLEMHGVYHTYNEFFELRDDSYINEGVIAFERCFGELPTGFKAPQLALSKENERLLEQRMNVYRYWNQLTHKVYHCNDTGRLPNKFIDAF